MPWNLNRDASCVVDDSLNTAAEVCPRFDGFSNEAFAEILIDRTTRLTIVFGAT